MIRFFDMDCLHLTAIFSILFIGCSSSLIPGEPVFEEQVIDADVAIGYGLGIGDVDGDGKDDILLADKKQFVWYRNPDWQRFVMVDSLTERDNVCIAVRDINGDGQVEVAVGAQWNPGETRDSALSGSVHYLERPDDPRQLWHPVKLHHEPTVHRMKWVKVGDAYQLIVLPLHGRGNQNGEGVGVRILAYKMPGDLSEDWTYEILDSSMHLTHNFDVFEEEGTESLVIGSKEGARIVRNSAGRWLQGEPGDLIFREEGFGEIRKSGNLIAGIQPMHGDKLSIFVEDGDRKILYDSLKQGHAVACADLLSQGQDQVVAGWREPNDGEEMGIKLFFGDDPEWTSWQSVWIDRNGIACEDLVLADLDSDGKKDIIGAGRSSHNLKIYWNRTD
jgi:hypothetical protein